MSGSTVGIMATHSNSVSILATDNFNRANGAIGTTNWTSQPGIAGGAAMQIVSNEASSTLGVTAPYFSGSLVGGGSWPNNQYAQITVGSAVDTTTDAGVGPMGRASTVQQTAYFGQTNTNETKVYKVVNGSYTQLGSNGAACATGDILKLICNGTSISATKNGTTIVGAVTDSAIASGSAGMWGTNGGSPTGTMDNFQGGAYP